MILMNDTNMLKEIREIAALKNCIEKNKNIIPAIAKEIKEFNPKNFMIVARGTSTHGGIFGKYFLELHTKIPVEMADPSIFTVYDSNMNLSNTIVIAISQSGKGYDVSTVLKKAKESGAYTFAITNNPNSLVAESTDKHIFNEIGETNAGAATKGFTTTLYILTKLALYLSDEEDKFDDDKYIESIKNALNLYDDIKPMAKELAKTNIGFSIARGYSYSLAKEFALKVMETLLVPIIPYKASEFCHGPLASTSSKTPVILFAIDDKTNPDIKRVITYLKDTKAKTYVITNDKEIAYSSDMAIMINETESIYAFYQAVILMQLLSCEMAFLKGTYQDHVPVLKGRTNTF